MENITKSKLALFVSNAQTIRKEFKAHNAMTKRLAALLYAQENKTIDNESIRQCHTMMKQYTGIFSSFRGNMSLCIAALLSLSPDPRGLFEKTLQVYDMLKAAKLRASDYLVVSAFQIASRAEPADYQTAVNRTREFYDSMKSHSFFTTGHDDYIFAAMLGLSDLDVASGAERIAQTAAQLKDKFWSKNSVQTLSQVLALGGSCDETISRVIALRDALRAQRIKLDKAYTLPVLGILALLPVEIDTIIQDISRAQQILKEQKGFSSWYVSKQEILIYAAAITAGEYAESAKCGIVTAAVSTSITNIIIAQQVAMIAIISSTTAAASVAASS